MQDTKKYSIFAVDWKHRYLLSDVRYTLATPD